MPGIESYAFDEDRIAADMEAFVTGEREFSTARIQDIRPGAVVLEQHNGVPDAQTQTQTQTQTITSYPYRQDIDLLGNNKGPFLPAVWVDISKDQYFHSYPGGKHCSTYERQFSLADMGVIPYETTGSWNKSNTTKLITAAPVTDEVPRKLRKLLEKPFSELSPKEQGPVMVYFLGAQAASFLERRAAGKNDQFLGSPVI